jgi:RNA polymerase sigma factor (sigma-70 family)
MAGCDVEKVKLKDLFPVSRRGGNIPVETMSEPDQSLIAEFNARRSEEAFAALVRQHANLVFATALRQVGDAGAAEEITQNVFVALALAAGKLGSHPTIAGWLHQTALNKSREWLRSELRRRKREQVAVNLDLARAEGDSVWASLVPLLDEALLELREPDRLAVILHFMEGQTFHEVGSALGIGEDTARKRVNRCLGQLTHFFRRRGFAAPALVAGTPLFALSSHAAPAGLAASATTAGLAAAHSAATSTLTLIKGALKIMAWTKAKTSIVVGIVAILAATSTTVIGIKLARAHRSTVEPTTGLSPIMQTVTSDIQPNGTILFQSTVEETNNTSRTISTDNINDVDGISRAVDESDKPMRITKRPRGGVFVMLNKAVPPGGIVSYTVEGRLAGFIKENGTGEHEIGISGDLGNVTEAHLVQVWRLPAGATLLGKDRGMDETTDAGRIELRIDKIVPPNGRFRIGFRYRLPVH